MFVKTSRMPTQGTSTTHRDWTSNAASPSLQNCKSAITTTQRKREHIEMATNFDTRVQTNSEQFAMWRHTCSEIMTLRVVQLTVFCRKGMLNLGAGVGVISKTQFPDGNCSNLPPNASTTFCDLTTS